MVFALINYIHELVIKKIIVSSSFAEAGDFIFNPFNEMTFRYTILPFIKVIETIYESPGNDAALPGATSLAFEEL